MNRKLLLCVMTMMPAAFAFAQDLKITADKKGRIGFADRSGNVVIECSYETATPFDDGVAIVSKSGKFGLIDRSGNKVLPLKYKKVSKWNESLYLLDGGKKKGLAAKTGEIVLPVNYLNISRPNCYGRALIALGGKIVASNGRSTMSGSKLGIIDGRGNVLVAPQYRGLSEFSVDCKKVYPYYEGMRLGATVYSVDDTLKTDCSYLGFRKAAVTSGSGVMDGNGNELMPQGKYDIVMLPQSNMIRYYMAEKKSTKFGYYNIETKESIEVGESNKKLNEITYWSHGDFFGNIAPVNGETWSFVDKTGKAIASGYSSLLSGIYMKMWAAKNKSAEWEMFDQNGKKLEALSGYQDLAFPKNADDKEIIVAKKADKWGAVSRNGETVVPFEYDLALANNHDMIYVKKGGRWGVVSTENKLLVPTEWHNMIFPAKKGEKHLWVSKSDSLYYHFNIDTQKTSGKGYKIAWSFRNGVAFVVPADMKVEDNALNRAQMLPPNAKADEIAAAKVGANVYNFGYLVGEDDVYLIDEPLYYTCFDRAVKEINRRGYTNLNKTQVKSVLFEITRENRFFNLNETLDEAEWDY